MIRDIRFAFACEILQYPCIWMCIHHDGSNAEIKMTIGDSFTLNPSSAVLTTDAPGLRMLVDGVKRGASILASQSKKHPIELQDTYRQWLICESSGTIGRPKAIRRRPETWIKSFDINAERYGLSAADTYATFGSLGHSLTLFATMEALSLGADICSLDKMAPRRQVQHLADLGVSVIYATPTQLTLLAKGTVAAKLPKLPLVRHIFSGGGKLGVDMRRALRDLFPAASIHEFFGASETSFITISDANTPAGSVGLPYPEVSVRIGDSASITPNETGEIWVSSPYLFDGYNSDTTDGITRSGAYLSVGDMGYLNAEGYLFLRGRKDRMVTVADKNVFPEEIEAFIGQMKGVDLCAVLSVPDQTRGNRLVCFVKTTSTDLSPTTIRNHCRTHLSSHAVPKEAYCSDTMPVLQSGKPDLRALYARLDAAR